MAVNSSACILCRRFQWDGKHGLYLKGYYICPECEAKLVSLSENDPNYETYITGLKKIWSMPGA